MSRKETLNLMSAYHETHVTADSRPPLGDHFVNVNLTAGMIIVHAPNPDKMTWLLGMQLAYREWMEFDEGRGMSPLQDVVPMVQKAWAEGSGA